MLNDMLTPETQEIVFSGGTLMGYFICGVVYIFLPFTLYFIMKRYNAERLYPVIVGAIVYFLTTRLSDLCAYIFGSSQSFAGKAVIAAELVCIFEEVGRWLAMRFPVADIRDTRSAVCYGIGHAGLECWIRGIEKFRIIHYGQQLSSDGLQSFISGKTEEKAAAITEQLRSFADHPMYLSFFDSVQAIITFCVHVALSLLIFNKIQETGGNKRWLLAAILLHYFLNFSTWLASLTDNMLFTDIIGILCGIIVILAVSKLISLKNCTEEILYPQDIAVHQ